MATSLLVLVFLLGLKIVSAEISFPIVTALHHLSISTFDNYGNAAADVTSDFVQQSQLPTQQVKVLTAFFFRAKVLIIIDAHNWQFSKNLMIHTYFSLNPSHPVDSKSTICITRGSINDIKGYTTNL